MLSFVIGALCGFGFSWAVSTGAAINLSPKIVRWVAGLAFLALLALESLKWVLVDLTEFTYLTATFDKTYIGQALIGLIFGLLAGLAFRTVFVPIAKGTFPDSDKQGSAAMWWTGILGSTLILGIVFPYMDNITFIKSPVVELQFAARKAVETQAKLKLKSQRQNATGDWASYFLSTAPGFIQQEIDYLDLVAIKPTFPR